MSVRSYRFRVREHDFSITFADKDKSFDVVCDALWKGLGIIDSIIENHDPAPYDLHTEEAKCSPYVSDAEPFVLDFSNTGKFVLELDVPGSRKLVIKGDGGYKPFTDSTARAYVEPRLCDEVMPGAYQRCDRSRDHEGDHRTTFSTGGYFGWEQR